MSLQKTWMLLLVVGTLGCGEKPEPVVVDEPVAEEEKQSPPVPEVGRDAAIAEIEKLGGSIWDPGESEEAEVFVSFYGSKVTDADLVHLKRLTSPHFLNLGSTQVSDPGLEHLKGLTSLRDLRLDRTQVTDAGMEHLKGLANLRSLSLGSTQVSDVGLGHLKGLTSLQGLWLSSTQVSDAGMEHLKGLANLRSLSLGSTQVSDVGLGQLKGLTSLESLSLSRQVTDAGLSPKDWMQFCRIDSSMYLEGEQVTGTQCEVIGEEDASVAGLSFVRKTYRVFVQSGISESHLRVSLFLFISRQMTAKPDIDAMIVLAYEKAEQEQRVVDFTPIGMLGWAPDGKWDNVSAEIAKTNDRSTYKYYIEISEEFRKKEKVGRGGEDKE